MGENKQTEIATYTSGNVVISDLTPEQQAMVQEYAGKIDIASPSQVLSYGLEAQKKLDGYTNGVLAQVKTKDLGDTGELITAVVAKLNECELDEPKGFKGLFQRGKTYVRTLKTKYEAASTSVEGIVTQLNDHQATLLKDLQTLETLYEQNVEYFKELSMYIAAGEQALIEARAKAAELQRRAEETGSQLDAQAYNDFMGQINRFEKKIHDLVVTREVSLQMAPQIRMLQQNNYALSEKLQSTIINTIPLWKNQLVISLGIQNALDAAAIQKSVTDATNKLLRSNAERLHRASVETATELERGIVDIDTLKHVNQELISTLDDVVRIQNEGIQARSLAKKEIIALEGELKTKLLSAAGEQYLPSGEEEKPITLKLTQN